MRRGDVPGILVLWSCCRKCCIFPHLATNDLSSSLIKLHNEKVILIVKYKLHFDISHFIISKKTIQSVTFKVNITESDFYVTQFLQHLCFRAFLVLKNNNSVDDKLYK